LKKILKKNRLSDKAILKKFHKHATFVQKKEIIVHISLICGKMANE